MALSYSQLSTYRRCPRQYEYASVKKLPRAMSEGESFGSSLHNTLRKFGLLELEKQQPVLKKQLALFTDDHHKDVPPDLSLTTLLSLWRESFIAEGYPSRAVMDARLMEGEAALKRFHEWWSREQREVVAIEKGFTFHIPGPSGFAFAGRFDRVERTREGLRIIDFKSTGPRDPSSLKTDLQLSMYAIAGEDTWKESVASLILLCVQENGVTEQATNRTSAELHDALTSIRLLHERMEAKDYAATPSAAICRQCPYRDICPVRAI